jgi:hypothetical protein
LQNLQIEGNLNVRLQNSAKRIARPATGGICGYLLNCNYSKGDEKWIQIALQVAVNLKEHRRAEHGF